MGSYEIRWLGAAGPEGDGPALDDVLVVVARDGMDALGLGLERLGLGRGTLDRAVCLLRSDGSLEVSDPQSATRVLVRQVEGDEDDHDPPSLEQASVLCAAEADDAPDPVLSPAFAGRGQDLATTLAALRQALEALAPGPPATLGEAVLDAVLRHVPAQSASILLPDAGGRSLRFAAVRGPHAALLRARLLPADRGIAGLVLRTGTSLRLAEVLIHPAHDRTVDRALGHRTRSLLAVPIPGPGRPRGVLELLNPFGDLPFTEDHRRLAELAAARLGAGLA